MEHPHGIPLSPKIWPAGKRKALRNLFFRLLSDRRLDEFPAKQVDNSLQLLCMHLRSIGRTDLIMTGLKLSGDKFGSFGPVRCGGKVLGVLVVHW